MRFRRLIALALIMILTMACVPFTNAIAEEAVSDDAQVLAVEGGDEAIGDDESAPVDEVVPVEEDVFLGGEDDALPEDDDYAVLAPNACDIVEELPVENLDVPDDAVVGDDLVVLAVSGDELVSKAVSHTVSITQSGGTVSIKGSVPAQYMLGGVIVDRTFVSQQIFGNSINYSFNINNGKFDTGYHTVAVGIYKKNADGTAGDVADVVVKNYISCNTITDKPSYVGSYEVYSNYFNIYPFQMSAFGLYAPKLYLEYSGDGGKTWKRSGYMKPSGIKLAIEEGYKISGLQPNTTYQTRLRYGEYVTYSTSYGGDGKEYFFGGPALTSKTIKTGMATAPLVKSVSLKAVKVKRHKVRHYGYYTGVYLYTERYYTCKFKVTVKLKKKPGTKGIWVSVNEGFGHTQFLQGDKKTYTYTFTPNVNYFGRKPKKCKLNYTVTVRSGQSKSCGGYSPSWSKSRRLK